MQYGQSTKSKNSSEKLGDASLKNNIHLDTFMIPQATGKLSKNVWRATTVMKKIKMVSWQTSKPGEGRW